MPGAACQIGKGKIIRVQRFVYLAGTITDCTNDEANDWRDQVIKKLHPNIIGVSPLRNEPSINSRYPIQGGEFLFNTPKAIASKNYYDANTCDLILAYLPKEYNDRRPSYGTIFELGWATGIQKLTILVTDDPTLIEHPLVATKVNWIVDNFDEAIDIIHGLFDVYTNN